MRKQMFKWYIRTSASGVGVQILRSEETAWNVYLKLRSEKYSYEVKFLQARTKREKPA